jgi:Ca2+-binding RTX toxin-like protein
MSGTQSTDNSDDTTIADASNPVDLSLSDFLFRAPDDVSVAVSNTGANNSAPSTLAVYLSHDSHVTTADTLLGSEALDSFGSGEGLFKDVETALPTSLAAGRYFIAATITPGAGDTDTDPSNNTTDPLPVHLGDAGDNRLVGTAGDDILIGQAGDDLLIATRGGNDTLFGGDGNDTIRMGNSLTFFDTINGGDGNDTLVLSGNYAGSTVTPFLTSIERLDLQSGEYNLSPELLGAPERLDVDAGRLTASETLQFDGTHAQGGSSYFIVGGAGNDFLQGGTGNDVLVGGLGADELTGGGGRNFFRYTAVAESTGVTHDEIGNFVVGMDKFRLPVDVLHVDRMVSGGALDSATFDQDLASAIGAKELAAHDAVLFMPTSGNEATVTRMFLVVDANGVAGYQAGQDYVIQIDGMTNAAHFNAHAFAGHAFK